LPVEYLKKAAVQVQKRKAEVEATVRRMLDDIAANRDEAVARYARELDGWTGSFRVSDAEIAAKSRSLSKVFKEDFAVCLRNVSEFAKRQKESIQAFEVELQPGVTLGQKLIPVSAVGCYVPGGKYPLICAAARPRRHLPANALCAARGGR
jgi:histidinol dehydrogenase